MYGNGTVYSEHVMNLCVKLQALAVTHRLLTHVAHESHRRHQELDSKKVLRTGLLNSIR